GGGSTSAALLARALLWQGEAAQAEEALAAHPPPAGDPAQLLRWGSTRVANFMFSAGDSTRADAVLQSLRQQITHPMLSLIVEGMASAVAAHENRLPDAVAAAERVFREPAAHPAAIEWACFGGGRALSLMGRGDEVDALSARMRSVADRLDGLLRYPAALGEIHALTLTGDLDTARTRAQRYFEFSSSGQYVAWALANTLMGTADVAQGRFGDAVPRLEQALAALHAKAAASWILPAEILLVQTYAAIGRTGDAAAIYADAQARMGRHVAIFEAQLGLARAWLAAAEGTTSIAIESARSTAESARSSGQHAIEAEALHAAVRFGDHDAAPRLAELAEFVHGRLVVMQARHATALAAEDAAALDASAAEFESIGALLSAADAAAQASNAHGAVQDRSAMLGTAATASRLAARCGGAVTPALQAAAHPLPLTVREREIANLVAAGLTNREVAERLVVSVRTVEGHVYRMCTKLGVADRGQLADLVRGGSRS
ncbi:MAG: helix-turn-helix transcriptional regulator, partial [Aldersonia sp.]|nr:helix-turn-helix transcriptional regulator [Aldersonia sp.]